MLTSVIAAMSIGLAGLQAPLHCPATLEAVTGKPAITMEYGGALFGTCCGGCDSPFIADPKGLIAIAIKANKTVGAFEYDPISGVRIDPAKAAGFSDYKAIRYYFKSADEKKSFDEAPAKFVGDVKAEAYFCPLMKFEMDSKDVGGYVDYKGVRYYQCCESCVNKFKADPAKYAANAAKAVKPLAAVVVKR